MHNGPGDKLHHFQLAYKWLCSTPYRAFTSPPPTLERGANILDTRTLSPSRVQCPVECYFHQLKELAWPLATSGGQGSLELVLGTPPPPPPWDSSSLRWESPIRPMIAHKCERFRCMDVRLTAARKFASLARNSSLNGRMSPLLHIVNEKSMKSRGRCVHWEGSEQKTLKMFHTRSHAHHFIWGEIFDLFPAWFHGDPRKVLLPTNSYGEFCGQKGTSNA